MRCTELINNLSAYLDGELEPELVQQIVRHLEHCEDCSIMVDTTRKTIQVCCSTEPAPLPPDVRERLNRLYQEKLGGKLSDEPREDDR